MKSERRKKFYIILGIFTFLGLLFRLIVSAQLLKNDPFAFAPSSDTDMATYHTLSDAICKGDFPKVFYYQPYYYSVFLPLAKWLTFGAKLWGPTLAQALCGAGIIWFAGLTAALLKGRKAGLTAGFLAAFSLILTVYTPYALLEISQCFHFTLLAYFTIRLMKKDCLWLWCGAGLVLSAAILSRGNAWCFLPALIIAFVYARKRFQYQAKKMLLHTGVFLLCLILPQLPFVIRNTVSLGQLTGPSSAGPAVLTLGNNPEAPPGGLNQKYPEGFEIWMAEEKTYPVWKRILDWSLKSPGSFIEFQGRKFLLFWDADEIPNNISMDESKKKSDFLETIPLIPTSLILTLAIGAFFLCLKESMRRRTLMVFLLMPILYALAAAAFYILARFRLPAVGLLCIQGGLCTPLLLAAYQKKDMRKLILYRIAPVFLAGVLVYNAYPAYSNYYEPAMMRFLRPDGVRLDWASGQTAIFDHGPDLPKPWQIMPLKPGMTIEKRLVIPPELQNKPGKAYLELRCIIQYANNGKLRLNGDNLLEYNLGIPPNKPFMFWTIAFQLDKIPADGIFRITMEEGNSAPGQELGLFIDMRRDYGRTYVDGKSFPGEAVIRLKKLP